MSSRRRESNASNNVREKYIRPQSGDANLPVHAGDVASPQKKTPGIKPAGESGRRGFHPIKFLKITLRSASRVSLLCSFLWPVVPAVFAVRYTRPNDHLLIFILTYIGMIPCANLVGFAGQELARKVPHVAGVLIETTFGSIVEIVLFMVLLKSDQFIVIQAAILGSILATMLLCLGLCFIASGVRRDETNFSEAVSEAGSGLLLIAGAALAIPALYDRSILETDNITLEQKQINTLHISRIISILLIIAYLVYVYFQARTHHGIFNAIFEEDEDRDHDKAKDRRKPKLTLTECIIGLVISITLVAFMSIYLVEQILPIVEERGISDPFMGLILVPLVEKAAEHLTAIDEAWDNQMNFALSHVLGATLQTALLNAPLTVIVGWGLHKNMDFNFEIFDIAMLILAIIIVGGFLRDQKSNYLEGFLCVIVYIAIAVAAFYYPNPPHSTGHEATGGEGTGGESSGGH